MCMPRPDILRPNLKVMTPLRPRLVGAVPLACLERDDRPVDCFLIVSVFCFKDGFLRLEFKTGGLQPFKIAFRLAKLGMGPLASLQG